MSANFDPDEMHEGWYSDSHSWHFQRRLWERRKTRLRYGEYSLILRKIKSGKIEQLKKGWYRISFRNDYLIIALHQDHPSTVLEKNAFKQSPNGRWYRPISDANFRKHSIETKRKLPIPVEAEEMNNVMESNQSE